MKLLISGGAGGGCGGGWVGVDIEQQNKPEEKAETGSHRALNAML